jgi:hypothetical protein
MQARVSEDADPRALVVVGGLLVAPVGISVVEFVAAPVAVVLDDRALLAVHLSD